HHPTGQGAAIDNTHHEPLDDDNAHGHAHTSHMDAPSVRDDHAHGGHGHGPINPHESPPVMLWPLYVLAVGAVLAGVVFYDLFFGHAEHVEHFFAGSVVVNAEMLD